MIMSVSLADLNDRRPTFRIYHTGGGAAAHDDDASEASQPAERQSVCRAIARLGCSIEISWYLWYILSLCKFNKLYEKVWTRWAFERGHPDNNKALTDSDLRAHASIARPYTYLWTRYDLDRTSGPQWNTCKLIVDTIWTYLRIDHPTCSTRKMQIA